MTLTARKKTHVRRGPAPAGKVRRGPDGEVTVEFVAETIDSGAPEYNVTGIASVERISVGQIRVAKYSKRKDGNFILFYEVWDYETYKRAFAPLEQAVQIIDRMKIGNGGEERQGKH